MDHRSIFAMIALVVLASPVASQENRIRYSESDLEDMYQAGYDSGFLDGRASAPGADRLRQCELLLDLQDTERNSCRAGKRCVDELAVAVHAGDAYLREVANRCIISAR